MAESQQPPKDSSISEDRSPNIQNIITIAPFIIACLILVGYSIFIGSLVTMVGVDDKFWIRLSDLFGSVEAIVFTAVGFLFGREVNRSRAINAEKEKKDAQSEAKRENKKKNDLIKRISEIPMPTAPSLPTPPTNPLFSLAEPNDIPLAVQKFMLKSQAAKVPVTTQIEKLTELKSVAKQYSDIE